MNLNLPTNKSAILKKLSEEKLIVKKRDKYNITNLGASLFANNLDEFPELTRKAVRVIIYKGRNRLKTLKEHISKKGYAISFENLINYINDKLPTNEEIGRVFRREVKIYPEIAIRELVANAIIHQDFYETGTSIMIEIFDDRIEITNPGKPLVNTLRFIDHSPQSRNEKLAYFMRRINICEERGTGIDKVVHSVELYQLPAPKFIEGENSLRATLYSHKTLRQMDKEDKIRACYQHCVIKYISNEYMTNESLRKRFNIDEKNYPMASKIISETIKANLIKADKRKYIPIWA